MFGIAHERADHVSTRHQSMRQVAAVMGVPLGTVKTRMLAAMRKLRDVLAPMGADLLAPGDLRGFEGGGL